MTAVYAYHPAEGDRPTTAELLDALHVTAETTRRGPDRIVAADLIITALDEGICWQCEGPLAIEPRAAACMRCEWRCAVTNTDGN